MKGKWQFVVLFFLMLVMSGPVASAVEYGGLGGVPANPDPNNPRTKSIFVYTISPGQNKLDGVNVVNNTGEPKTVEVYATDSEIASGGAFACRQKVEPKNNVGSWIRLNQSEIKLEPNTNQILPFEVLVPANTNVGEHNGCLVIQEKDGKTEKSGNGVQLSFRSALRVAITVPGDIIKHADFTDLKVKPGPEKYIISSQLHNKGNVSLDTDVEVFVKNLFGQRVYKNGGAYPLLAQKNPVELDFEFKRPFWGGYYRFSGTAQYNGDPKEPLGGSAPKHVRKLSPTRSIFIWPKLPALALILLAVLIGLTIIYLLVKRRLASQKVAINWETHTVRKGETLIKLAESHNVKWKTIVKINKLCAPYELQKGMKIKLPVNRNNE